MYFHNNVDNLFSGVVTYARHTYEKDLPPANYGCAVTLKDEFWYLGGNNYEGFQRYVSLEVIETTGGTIK